MRLFVSCLVCVVVAGCGGGGSGGTGGVGTFVPLTTNVIQNSSTTARVSYVCSGTAQENGGFVQTVFGTMELRRESTFVISPINSIQAAVTRITQDFTVGGSRLFQVLKSYSFTDSSGRIWSLGGQDTDGNDYWWFESLDYSLDGIGVGLVQGMYLTSLPTMSVGDHIAYDFPTMTGVDSAVQFSLLERSGTRRIVGIEVVDTPLGRFEAYRVEQTSNQTDFVSGFRVVTSATSWERPDMGALVIQSTGTVTDGSDTVILSLRCEITAFSP